MNPQVLKTIRQSMCPKEKWIPDKDVTNCFKCDSRFNKLFRWKHHCRICGRIFCSPCCQFYLIGTDLGEDDKPIRTCEFCNRKFWSYIVEKDRDYYAKRNPNTIRPNPQNQVVNTGEQISIYPKLTEPIRFIITESERIKEIQALVADFQIQVDPMPLQKLWQTAEAKLSIIIQIIFKMNKIPFVFYEWVHKICKKIIGEIPANAMITREMDICKNIKIKCQKSEDVRIRMVVGTLIKKNRLSKKVQKNFENVNVLLLYGNMEEADIMGVRENSLISFEEVIENKKNQIMKLIQKLRMMQIGVIFLEGSLDRQMKDMLFQSEIAVISNVDVRALTRIKVSLEITKIVEKLRDIDPTCKQNCVGRSKLVYFTKVRNFEGQQDNALIVEGTKASTGLTVFMSGPDKQPLKLLKYEFKQLLRIARHLILKIYKLLLDQDMMMSMSADVRSTLVNSNEANIFFSSNLQSQGTMVAYLRHRYLIYKRIVFVESDYSPQTLPELTKQMAEQYIKKKHKHFKAKWPSFTEICQIVDQSRRVYSTDDLPLGEYILRKLLSMSKKCEQCRKPLYQHIEVFYWLHLYAKVEVQSRIIDYDNKEEKVNEFGTDQMFEELSKIKDKQKIMCYIECNDCSQRLSGKFTLRQQHLELSYITFIGHIFHSTHIAHLKYPRDQPKGSSCQHVKKSRIFQLGSFFVKIYTDFLIVSQQMVIHPVQRANYIQAKEDNAKSKLSLMFGVNLQNICSFIKQEIQKVAQASKNSNMPQIMKNPKESFIKAASQYLSLGKNVSITKNEFLQIIIPELMQYLSRINYFAINLISKQSNGFLQMWNNYANLTYLLSRILKILDILGKRSHKDSHILHVDTFQGSLLKQSIDINEQLKQEQLLQTATHLAQESPIESNHQSSNQSNYWVANQFKRGSNFPSLMSNKLKQTVSSIYDLKLSRDLVNNILHATLGNFKYNSMLFEKIPCNESYQSLISNALNSDLHKQAIKKSLSEIQIKLFRTEYQIVYNHEEVTRMNLMLDVHQKCLESLPLRKKTSQLSFEEVCVLFPKEFQAIRTARGINLEAFIMTLVGTDITFSTDNRLNNSNSSIQSINDTICMKSIPERQYRNVMKLLPKYFSHLLEPTLLVPIYGVFEVNKNSKSQYIIIMQNLYFGIDKWISYDLKGSRWKRFSKYANLPLDVNFLIDRNSEPLFSSVDVLRHLKKTVQFLADNDLIDYSLTLILKTDETEQYLDGCKIKVGIQNYYGVPNDSFSKVVGLNANESQAYAERFMHGVKKYFWSIPL